ncbi:hypothetical protein B4U80_05818, partial [Leptotrombidium deliense]
RGPARDRHPWTGLQPAEEQGVGLPRLQPQHRCLPLCPPSGEVPGRGAGQQPSRQPPIANSNHMNKSESDQEDNDGVSDNDWSCGSEKKAKKRTSDKNPNSP